MFVVALNEFGKGGEGIPAAVLLNADLAHGVFAEFFCGDEFALYAHDPEDEQERNGNDDNDGHNILNFYVIASGFGRTTMLYQSLLP